MTYEEFAADARTIDAVVRNIEISGEAAKNIPSDGLEIQPNMEWKNISRLPDIIVHRYFKVDLEIVWGVVKERIGELHEAIHYILDNLEESYSD